MKDLLPIVKEYSPKWWSIIIWLIIMVVCSDLLQGSPKGLPKGSPNGITVKDQIVVENDYGQRPTRRESSGDTLIFEVKGLVCSFCAHGLNKGIGKMNYTNEKGILVDINNQIVRVILNKKYKSIPSSVINQTIKVIQDSGYEVFSIKYKDRVLIISKND